MSGASAPDLHMNLFYPEELELSADNFRVKDINTDLVVPIIRGTFEQCLFVDDGDHIVIGHETCVVGDEVWLMMGSALPHILRPLATGGYEFKGEAYVHGIMDGEYLVKNFKNLRPESTSMHDDAWLASLGDSVPFETTEITLI